MLKRWEKSHKIVALTKYFQTFVNTFLTIFMLIHLCMSILFCIFVDEMGKAPVRKPKNNNKNVMAKQPNYKGLIRKVNEILNTRADSAWKMRNENMLVRHLEASEGRIRLQPTYSETFYNIQQFIDLAKRYGYEYFVTAELNHADVYAPVLHLYPSE